MIDNTQTVAGEKRLGCSSMSFFYKAAMEEGLYQPLKNGLIQITFCQTEDTSEKRFD